MSIELQQYVEWFRSTSPYINAHRGKTFVLYLSSGALAHANIGTIIEDTALLNSLGVRVVLVFGAKQQIEQDLAAKGIATETISGRRVTNDEALPVVINSIGRARAKLEALLSRGLSNASMQAQHLRFVSGNMVTAKPLGIIDGVDFKHTGEVRRVHAAAIQEQLENGYVVLLPPQACSPSGETFNLSALQLAEEVAIALQADKLILLTDETPLDANSETIKELQLLDVDRYLTEKSADTMLARALRSLKNACASGVQRGQIIDYHADGALLKELFSREGCGTLVSKESFERVRQADIQDINGILELISPLEADGTLVRRSREKIEEEIEFFAVIEREGMIIACAALYPFNGEASGELACVVTHAEYRGGNRGAKLLQNLSARARHLGLQTLYVLTTKTAHWFLEQGFVECDKDELPAQRKALYNLQRNSKVFQKQI
jgi:amino-acid N-acetyltransferase